MMSLETIDIRKDGICFILVFKLEIRIKIEYVLSMKGGSPEQETMYGCVMDCVSVPETMSACVMGCVSVSETMSVCVMGCVSVSETMSVCVMGCVSVPETMSTTLCDDKEFLSPSQYSTYVVNFLKVFHVWEAEYILMVSDG